jgi:putative PIN family toxin of toxin-antitoxin system
MFEVCVSHGILDETRQSLRNKVKRIRRYYAYPDEKIDLFIDGVIADAQMVSNLPRSRVVPLDSKDDVIMATAVKAQADFLVTGDRHLGPIMVLRSFHCVGSSICFDRSK